MVTESIERLDQQIHEAMNNLHRARALFSIHPSSESLDACEAAEAALNELLDARCLLTQAKVPVSA